MQTVELKLAHWRKIYGELNDVQQHLREAKARRPDAYAAAAELEARVSRLQQESNGALDEVHAALAASRARADAPKS
jgi:hypothetical protein